MPHSEEVPFFLAQELEPGYFAGIDGEYMPPKGYFVAEEHPDEFAAYESTFPRREKLRLPTQLFEDITKSLLLFLAICEDEYLETNLSILSEGLAKHLKILMKQRLW